MSSKIKSETVYRIDHLPGDEINLEDDLDGAQSYNEFDENGHLVLEIAYTRDGEIADKMEYRHDGDKLVETLIYGEDDEILERREMIWSDDQRLTQEIVHYLDGSVDIHNFFYDENGNLTGIEVKDDEDELEYSEKYHYEGDKVVKVEKFNGDDELIFKQEDEYKDGSLRTRTIWSSEDEQAYTLVQHFNPRGHKVEELRYDEDEELIERNVYEEDENGRVVKLVEENKQRKNTSEFDYDEKGNVIHQKETSLTGELNHELWRTYDPDGEIIKTTVEYIGRPSMQLRAYTLIYKREYYS